ncbi:hypothetical protein RB25_11065 [Herbaspirillum rubrisubalbicans]|jgi:hypothetical protein|uniref:Uncharacterized protein n=2 Tax=Herbaspirillum rubrisubalbicans TaxID=80842 RepID=A0ABX9BZF7_9BURK|nr:MULTISPECIES: DUF6139 family protein [Herbaspirillum]MCP1573081.1 hypothetical protein [Herbaspirillum rubrisubalbicans]NQE47424.1 hypothetical protein [Herbaspirillum rubrisubalbicans]QJQ01627.1 hypothetical protein C798_15700 [Herbaspirillum rubrisubalbicans Os34]RAM63442.1 hypothetical protein RB24_16765 [Herbaspirillum rubrisubalbicans]RAN48328.1 hypothetical protein RB25_11065 [Herbaspirillum rubrisubalbicans]
MKVDVYKRPDGDGLFSYLVLPHEEALPDEVTNTDWQIHEQNVDFERDGKRHFTLEAEDAFMQIGEKGYAITHLNERSEDGAA